MSKVFVLFTIIMCACIPAGEELGKLRILFTFTGLYGLLTVCLAEMYKHKRFIKMMFNISLVPPLVGSIFFVFDAIMRYY